MREIKINGVYKHFKGDSYIVIDVAYDSETKEKWLFIVDFMAMDHFGLDL